MRSDSFSVSYPFLLSPVVAVFSATMSKILWYYLFQVLEAIEKFPDLSDIPEHKRMKEMFVDHARAIKRFQAVPDGRWRQVSTPHTNTV